jgi:hypothetical protein
VVLRNFSAQGLVQQIPAISIEKGREVLCCGRCGKQEKERERAQQRSDGPIHDASLEIPDRIG